MKEKGKKKNVNILNDKLPQLGGNLDWQEGYGYMKKYMEIRTKTKRKENND